MPRLLLENIIVLFYCTTRLLIRDQQAMNTQKSGYHEV